MISFLFIGKTNIIQNIYILITLIFQLGSVVRQESQDQFMAHFLLTPAFQGPPLCSSPFLTLLHFSRVEIPLKEFVGVFWRTWLVLLLPLLLAPLLFVASEPQVLPTAPAGASITVHCALANREECPNWL